MTEIWKCEGGEAQLLECIRAETHCAFDKAQPRAARTIRGTFLAQVLRGQLYTKTDSPMPCPRKLGLSHAIIDGPFDLSDCHCPASLRIEHSIFKTAPNFERARLQAISFEGSTLPGASFNDLTLQGHLWLNHLKCTETLNLPRANIGGQFSANDATFSPKTGDAIYAQGAEIKDHVVLKGTTLKATAHFAGAKIGGQFAAIDATFSSKTGFAINAQYAEIQGGVFLDHAIVTAPLKFLGAQISGDMFAQSHKKISGVSICAPSQTALILSDARIDGSLRLDNVAHMPLGHIALSGAVLGELCMSDRSYPLGGLNMEGLSYERMRYNQALDRPTHWQGVLTPVFDRVDNEGFWDSYRALYAQYISDDGLNVGGTIIKQDTHPDFGQTLLARLKSNPEYPTFTPQPWLQYARALEQAGHESEARSVRIEAARRQSKLNGERAAKHGVWPALRWLYRQWRKLFKWTAGYGLAPWRSLYFLASLFIVGTLIFWLSKDQMSLARETVYMDADYSEYKMGDPLPEGYPEFSPLMYSADVMLPIIDFGQESHWRPENTANKLKWLRWYNRFHLAAGWFLSSIGLLGLTGLIRGRTDP